MEAGFTETALSRSVDFVAQQRDDLHFRGAPVVDLHCTFHGPARYGEVVVHEIALPVFGERRFRIAHRFRLPDGTLAAEGEQVRIWGRGVAGVLRVVAMPETIAAASPCDLWSPRIEGIGHGF